MLEKDFIIGRKKAEGPFKLKIEVGKLFQTRGGLRVIVKEESASSPYPFRGHVDVDTLQPEWLSWRADGSYLPAKEGPHKLDIVKEW